MTKINCELSSPSMVKNIEVNLKFKMKVGGNSINDILDAVNEFIQDDIVEMIAFDVDEIRTEIKD